MAIGSKQFDSDPWCFCSVLFLMHLCDPYLRQARRYRHKPDERVCIFVKHMRGNCPPKLILRRAQNQSGYGAYLLKTVAKIVDGRESKPI
jgi:hypothetical protein